MSCKLLVEAAADPQAGARLRAAEARTTDDGRALVFNVGRSLELDFKADRQARQVSSKSPSAS